MISISTLEVRSLFVDIGLAFTVAKWVITYENAHLYFKHGKLYLSIQWKLNLP